jgi:hypothetical protein
VYINLLLFVFYLLTGLNDSDVEETDNDTSTDEISVRRSLNTSMPADARSVATTEDYTLSATMVIPLDSKNNFLKLIRRIRRQGKNITLEIISKWLGMLENVSKRRVFFMNVISDMDNWFYTEVLFVRIYFL